MTTIAISPHTLTKEGRDLERAAKALCSSRVLLIDPHKTWCALEYDVDDQGGPKIYHDGEDISDTDIFIVRRSVGYGAATSIMSRVLLILGCNVVDPPSRYSVGFSSKITTSISRYDLGIGSESYFSFYKDGAHDMADYLRKNKKLPVIVKPINGKRSKGITVVKTSKRLKKIADQFFDNRKNNDVPFFVQKFENILHEYRVLLMHGKVISIIEKTKNNRMARGSAFVVPQNDCFQVNNVTGFCEVYCSDWGIVGADVAETDRGMILIEENRAPGWKRFGDVTGVDVADVIVRRSLEETSRKLDENCY